MADMSRIYPPYKKTLCFLALALLVWWLLAPARLTGWLSDRAEEIPALEPLAQYTHELAENSGLIALSRLQQTLFTRHAPSAQPEIQKRHPDVPSSMDTAQQSSAQQPMHPEQTQELPSGTDAALLPLDTAAANLEKKYWFFVSERIPPQVFFNLPEPRLTELQTPSAQAPENDRTAVADGTPNENIQADEQTAAHIRATSQEPAQTASSSLYEHSRPDSPDSALSPPVAAEPMQTPPVWSENIPDQPDQSIKHSFKAPEDPFLLTCTADIPLPFQILPDYPALSLPSPIELDADEQGVVLLVGDSMMMEGMGPILLRELHKRPDLQILRKAVYSTGLCRRDYFDWPAYMAELVQTHKPHLVIICLGANDSQDIVDADKKRHFLGSLSWEHIYQQRAEELMAAATAQGARVVWVGLPIMGNERHAENIPLLSERQRLACEAAPCVFVDTWSVLADKHGYYTTFITKNDGKRVRVRSKDKVHVSNDGGAMLAEKVLPVIWALLPERPWNDSVQDN